MCKKVFLFCLMMVPVFMSQNLFAQRWGSGVRTMPPFWVSIGGGIGFAALSMEDFRTSGDTRIYEASLDVDKTADISNFTSSFGLGGEFRIGFSNFAFGIGLTGIRGYNTEKMTVANYPAGPAGDAVETTDIKVNASVVPITLYYKIPMSEKKPGTFYIGGGISMYNVTLDYIRTEAEPGKLGEFKWGTLEGQGGTGYHLVVGGETFVSENIAVSLDIGGSFAVFSDFKGRLTDEDGKTAEYLLIMKREPGLLNKELLAVKDVRDPLNNERAAEVNFNGLRMSIAVRYYF